MSVRAITIGLLLGLGISAAAYFNDFVIGQLPLVTHLLPATVVGFLLALVLVVNPLARWLGVVRPLSTAEVAVMAALGLSACSFPDTGFFRGALTNTAMPAYLHPGKARWQSQEVLSYVPGGSSRMGEGHVQDWPGLARGLATAGAEAPQSVLGRLWAELSAQQRHTLEELAAEGRADAGVRQSLVRALNQLLEQESLHTAEDAGELDLPPPARALLERRRGGESLNGRVRLALNRRLLVASLPGVVLPPPTGEGVLLMGGYRDPVVVESLMYGSDSREAMGLTGLPWAAWWPVLRLWGGLALLLGAATFCLALIVHPQWSRSELLPYPIARLINDLCQRESDRLLPTVMRSRTFWWGFGLLFAFHLLNGLAVWFPDHPLPTIPRQLNFAAMGELFPTASRLIEAQGYLTPTLIFSIIAFAFFIPAKVSFSVGIAPLLFIGVAVMWLKSGMPVDNHPFGAGRGNMLRVGAYLGMALIIAYTGRQYYARVAAGVMGLTRTAATGAALPRSTVWAGRSLILCIGGAAARLTTGGLHWTFAILCVLMLLLIYLVIARITAETGMFVVQPFWVPVAVFLALMGFEAIGPTTFIVLGLASTLFISDTRSLLAGFLVNAFQIVDRAKVQPARVAPWVALMIVSGFVVAGAASLYVAYHFDAFSQMDPWTRQGVPAIALDRLGWYLAETGAGSEVAQMTARGPWQQWAAMQPDWTLIGWTGLGLALLVGCAGARLHLPWWPVHPVLFLVWGTFPTIVFAVSFLLGWAIKVSVTATTGAAGYRTLMPLMWGVIAGEVAISCLWLGVGAIYYFHTGMTPPAYAVFR
ncbi:MAG: DUF6785 family protein [Phycisphaeraceae bacterium]